MSGECYFCHGLVLPDEDDDILLDGHADHSVFMHEQCATGYDAIRESSDPSPVVEIVCPECGVVETRG